MEIIQQSLRGVVNREHTEITDWSFGLYLANSCYAEEDQAAEDLTGAAVTQHRKKIKAACAEFLRKMKPLGSAGTLEEAYVLSNLLTGAHCALLRLCADENENR